MRCKPKNQRLELEIHRADELNLPLQCAALPLEYIVCKPPPPLKSTSHLLLFRSAPLLSILSSLLVSYLGSLPWELHTI